MLTTRCIRVEDHARFARWLYGEQPRPNRNAPEQRVDIPDPAPVYLAYFTAVPAADGFEFREDIYGHDAPRMALAGR